jgi:SM-20-related protein
MEEKFECLIQGILDESFGMADGFVGDEMLTGLRENLLRLRAAHEMEKAGVGKLGLYRTDEEIRGDYIHWLDNNTTDIHERAFFDVLAYFIRYLNVTCFTSINDYEFHYAAYPAGTFYQRHLDRFQTDSGRRFSFILYLNEQWDESDGGELALYLPDRTLKVLPIGKRAVFFKSDELEHEVLRGVKERYSLTGWLKSV